MLDGRYLRTLPSYFTGSFRQTLATLHRAERFAPRVERPVVLVPGAFCTPSVMNRLGRALSARGFGVRVAPNFPYYLSALANLCRLERAVDVFLGWLDGLAVDGLNAVDVVAHSNGGLIALLAQERLDRGVARSRVALRRLVTMATPFGGFPGARVLAPVIPCCRDLVDGGEPLSRAARVEGLVHCCLVSAGDSLIPPVNQVLPGRPRVVLEGFQHMDFIVGSPSRIERTAEEVTRWLPDAC